MKKIFLVFLFLSSLPVLYGQTKNELDKFYYQRIETISDSIINESRLFMDTIFMDFDSTYIELTNEYDEFFRDSVYAEVKDSINSVRLDSLNKMSSSLKSKIYNLHTSIKIILNSSFGIFESSVNENKKIYTQCTDCEDKEDYFDTIEEYGDVLDSISGEYQDNISGISDSLQNIISDSVYKYMEDIYSYSQDLFENQIEEDDVKTAGNETENNWDEGINSKISLEANYYNHVTYRGRDNGIYENAFSPAVTFEHSSGLGISAAFYFANKNKKSIDEIDLTGYFTYDFTENMHGLISLTHYFFNDSSTNAKSVLKNSLTTDFNFEYPYIDITTSLNLDFAGSLSEFSLFLIATSPIPLSQNFINGNLDIEPTLTAIYGQQKDVFLNKLPKGKGKGLNAPKAINTFGIMDYELSIPVVYTSKYLSIKPYFTYIIPFNVLDNSPRDPFFTFTIELSVPFYLK